MWECDLSALKPICVIGYGWSGGRDQKFNWVLSRQSAGIPCCVRNCTEPETERSYLASPTEKNLPVRKKTTLIQVLLVINLFQPSTEKVESRGLTHTGRREALRGEPLFCWGFLAHCLFLTRNRQRRDGKKMLDKLLFPAAVFLMSGECRYLSTPLPQSPLHVVFSAFVHLSTAWNPLASPLEPRRL